MIADTVWKSKVMSESRQTALSREAILEKVRNWGDFNTDAVLDPACQVFTTPEIDGLLGYRREGAYAVVFGLPVCAPEERTRLAAAFHTYCAQQQLEVIYLMIDEAFSNWVLQNYPGVLIEYGERLTLDPHQNPADNPGTKGSLVRRKAKRAIKEGVMIHEYTGSDAKLEQALEEVGEAWLKKRRGAQIHISHVNLFDDRVGKRWFYAQLGHEIAGILVLNRLEAQDGWLMNHVMVTPNAPTGCSEHLITSTLRTLQAEGCECVVLGAAPIRSIGKVVGLPRLTSWLLRAAYQLARKVFRLDGLIGFWEKFQPTSKPSYLLFAQKSIRFRALKELLKALNAL